MAVEAPGDIPWPRALANAKLTRGNRQRNEETEAKTEGKVGFRSVSSFGLEGY